jgi:hypothetical protein
LPFVAEERNDDADFDAQQNKTKFSSIRKSLVRINQRGLDSIKKI